MLKDSTFMLAMKKNALTLILCKLHFKSDIVRLYYGEFVVPRWSVKLVLEYKQSR